MVDSGSPAPPLHIEDVEEENIFSLPTDEIVRKAILVLSERTALIIWGSLLDQHLGLPRIQKVCCDPCQSYIDSLIVAAFHVSRPG